MTQPHAHETPGQAALRAALARRQRDEAAAAELAREAYTLREARSEDRFTPQFFAIFARTLGSKP